MLRALGVFDGIVWCCMILTQHAIRMLRTKLDQALLKCVGRSLASSFIAMQAGPQGHRATGPSFLLFSLQRSQDSIRLQEAPQQIARWCKMHWTHGFMDQMPRQTANSSGSVGEVLGAVGFVYSLASGIMFHGYVECCTEDAKVFSILVQSIWKLARGFPLCMVARKICKRCWRCHNPGHVILTLEWSVGFSFFCVLVLFLARVYQGVVSSHPCFWKHPVANAQGMLPVRFCGWQDLARSAFFASAAIPLRTKYDCRLIDIAIGFVILMLIKLFPLAILCLSNAYCTNTCFIS